MQATTKKIAKELRKLQAKSQVILHAWIACRQRHERLRHQCRCTFWLLELRFVWRWEPSLPISCAGAAGALSPTAWKGLCRSSRTSRGRLHAVAGLLQG